jgi:hypothetical protein
MIMKKSIFKRAWVLFKQYSINFSQALIKAWNDYKRELLIKAHQLIPSTAQYKKKKEAAHNLWRSFKGVDFECRLRNVVANSGAAAYYGKGLYNAD